jgi:hypothetical protein
LKHESRHGLKAGRLFFFVLYFQYIKLDRVNIQISFARKAAWLLGISEFVGREGLDRNFREPRAVWSIGWVVDEG